MKLNAIDLGFTPRAGLDLQCDGDGLRATWQQERWAGKGAHAERSVAQVSLVVKLTPAQLWQFLEVCGYRLPRDPGDECDCEACR